MEGEDLQGLNFDDLQLLENMLQTGIDSVNESKVYIYIYIYNLDNFLMLSKLMLIVSLIILTSFGLLPLSFRINGL